MLGWLRNQGSLIAAPRVFAPKDPYLSSYSCAIVALRSALGDGNFQRELVDHFVALVGDNESVAEENPEQAVGGDRVGLRHYDHTGFQHLLERFGGDMLGDNVRLVSDEIDAMALRRPRLHTLVTEELAGPADLLAGPAGRDLGDDLLVTGQRDLVPEFPHHLGRLAQANRRADLCGVTAIAGGELHVDDVALFEHAARRARIAEHQRRIFHRRRANDEEVDVAAALQDGGAGGRTQLVFLHAWFRARDHRMHGVLAELAGLAHAVELLLAVD